MSTSLYRSQGITISLRKLGRSLTITTVLLFRAPTVVCDSRFDVLKIDKTPLTSSSYGSYFLTQLLGASSNSPFVEYQGYYQPFDFENLDDERFNIRDTRRGLNMDFMSYANLFKVDMDPLTLLDPDTLLNHTQHTFQTFFQHYASQTKWLDGSMMAYETRDDGGDKLDVIITERIQTLVMVPAATWLSVAIIFILMCILIFLTRTLKTLYPRTVMERNVECLADLLLLIENSEEFLGYAEKYNVHELKHSTLLTKLGWFVDSSGVAKWGIEVVDGNVIRWIERPEHVVAGELVKYVFRSLRDGPK
jgi:hypothetical protein